MEFRFTRWRFGLVLKRSAFSVFNGYFQIEFEFSGKVCNFKMRKRGIADAIALANGKLPAADGL